MVNKTKVGANVEVGKGVDAEEKSKDDRDQESTMPSKLATVFVKRSSRKNAKVGQAQKRELDNLPLALDTPPQESVTKQKAAPSSTGRQSNASRKHSPTKRQTRSSAATKKRKSQQHGTDSRSAAEVHGSDLFLQARLAAEENTRLSAGKATHPFFARPNEGGARSSVIKEPAQTIRCRSLNPAPEHAETNLQVSPRNPLHPFVARQNLRGAKAIIADEAPDNCERHSQLPCPPLHITQNMPEEETLPTWNWNWKCSGVPVKAGEKIEDKWSFSCCQPSYTWSWSTSKKRKRRGQPIPKVAVFGRIIDYLTNYNAGTKCLFDEEVDSVAARTQKLVEKFSSYYHPCVNNDCFEQNLELRPVTERRVKDVSGGGNSLWTNQYQPRNSQEVCGNKEPVRALSSWLQNWREKILRHNGAVKSEEVEDSSNDDDSEYEDSASEIDDSDDLHNCLLVTGSVGCGKSAAIYACAMEHGFTVIEVNASECRSGAMVKHKFKEAMESHGLSKGFSTASMDPNHGSFAVDLLSKQGEGCGRSTSLQHKSENQLSKHHSVFRSNLPPPFFRGLRVILFEDVDIVFEEDSGFSGALALLARTSKCPIIFSSNSQNPVLPNVSPEVIRFEQPSTGELVAHAYMVFMSEGLTCSPDTVEHIVRSSGRDIRKLLMLLQFWSQGSTSDAEHLKGVSTVGDLRISHINMQSPNLVSCLLQLDGCPQFPASRIHAASMLADEHTSNDSEEVCHGKKLRTESICKDHVSRKRFDRRSLDSDLLYAHDCQHRVLPLLFPDTEACQLTVMVFKRLKDAGQDIMMMIDYFVSKWSRIRFDVLKSKSETEFRVLNSERNLHSAARKEDGKLCSRGGSNKCMANMISLLQENERSCSGEREDYFISAGSSDDHDMCDVHLTSEPSDGIDLEDDEWIRFLPVLNMNTLSSTKTEWIPRRRKCSPASQASRSPSSMAGLGVVSSPLSVDISAVTAEAYSQTTNLALEGSFPLRLGRVDAHTPVEEVALNLTPNSGGNLAMHPVLKTPSDLGKQSYSYGASLEHFILSVAHFMMEKTWSEVRSLQPETFPSNNLDSTTLLDDVLHDLSACDLLSRRAAVASKTFKGYRISDCDDCDEYDSGDRCRESAVVLAQLRLNQALGQATPSNILFSETWRARPSTSDQDAAREEKRAYEDECVDLLLPQRCMLSGRLARLDYISFHSQLTSSTAGSEVQIRRTTRQRKPITVSN
ncbi:uncharacterized protein [Physcomitrium patens]|nr:uncharacterized protein LOC112289301 isoform X2 [Physcomitrium patens]XP_024390190.1 uncharacterized protein LOC112289301 isoform X2 [Physcomitrium patens]XP_024390191.1 uncharacterized protein LOC112289301 isoform X2 [Physcomitrium patens]|eukprot:XP_024390189.1 uncharacterized protein LOC112289301 isoform X2 [Physcomitrella patens]